MQTANWLTKVIKAIVETKEDVWINEVNRRNDDVVRTNLNQKEGLNLEDASPDDFSNLIVYDVTKEDKT